MKTSTHGLTLIEQREGIRLTGYKDSKGLPTIGVGHLIKPGEPYRVGKKITQEECDRLFADDIKTYENAVNGAVKVPLSQNQFDALVSISLNIGVQGFKNSTIVRRLNAKNYKGAADAIMFWNKPPEIKGRRRTEQKQFLTPGIPATTAANDGNPSLPTPSNTVDQSDPNSTITADTANPDTAPDLSGNGGSIADTPDETTPADPSPQTTADATPIQQMQPYMGVGFVSVIKGDLAKVTGGNVTMQTISGYRDDIAQWGIPAKVLLNLAALTIAVSAIYLMFRLVHYLVWVAKEHQRIKAELAVNANPMTPNIEWTNTKVVLPDTIQVPAVVTVQPPEGNQGT